MNINSPSSSASSSPRSTFSMASNSSSFSSSPRDISGSSPYSSSSQCSHPNWPNSFGSGMYRNNTPSSYISDEDLFGEDLFGATPLLEEAPAPPRMPPMPEPVAQPLLPLYATPKKSRRASSKKQRRPSKLAPIAESPSSPKE
ncbi:hypothetical protein GTA08_BOTSDO05449 [Botryosphaeria dothidea]|uniref:Uncharacterized protein n=1 Tax=Botryosphaeria dothidea TaxID=55169 RepID=A0A8H4IS65_9PEZI|nr:hypothetical protein GTA08_BOTSDO05449 [Botryosphaeria dothidea]